MKRTIRDNWGDSVTVETRWGDVTVTVSDEPPVFTSEQARKLAKVLKKAAKLAEARS